ncbi:hypothetical protein TERMP_01740 [Thermococcus barophilus MP]|uniref:Uncharacterized protein n=1 Tax=Thermococcus barophilus (strain DSM 11836 / MP) TaxID=391623 RepID=F0LJS3_THEBM|nr:hypothetical protein TERMP_01740 [Thermococcus barophilus MP]
MIWSEKPLNSRLALTALLTLQQKAFIIQAFLYFYWGNKAKSRPVPIRL